MENSKTEEIIQKREKKLIDWIKQPSNLAILGILILAFIVRLYYFIITKNQALWWDGACYGALAKNLITHYWDNAVIILGETEIRPPLMPFLWSLLLRLELQELTIKFLFEFLPSLATVLLFYLVAEKMFNKRIAIFSSLILAVSWIHVFYSMRLLTHIPALFLSVLSIYFFLKAVETEKIHLVFFALSIFSAFLSILMRWSFGLIGIAYILFLVFTRKLSFLKQKSFWIGGLLGTIPIIIFFLINLIKVKHFFPALSVYGASALSKSSYAFYTFGFFSHILQLPFFILFLLGLAILLIQLALGFGMIFKSKKLSYYSFLLTLLVLNLIFLVCFIRYAEDRYLFECFISIIFIVALGIDYIYLFIKKYSKIIAIIFAVLVLLLGIYYQFNFGDNMIKEKAQSFYQIKEAFLWLKDNTPENSSILSSGTDPWTIYYAERMQISFNETMTLKELNPDYVVVHAFPSQSKDFIPYLQNYEDKLIPLAQIFFDPDKTAPAVTIYKFKK